MTIVKLVLLFAFTTTGFSAIAVCPENEKVMQVEAPRFLIKLAARESKGQITDFSSKIGAEASAGTSVLKSGAELWYFVRADTKTDSISGVVKCDLKSKALVALSLGWHRLDGGSAVVGGPLNN